MHTEDEAKKLWCPMAVGGGTNNGRLSTCIASGCAMWRWAEPENRKCPKCAGMAAPGGGGGHCTTCFGTGRTKRDDRRGYCGLAGGPV